MGLYYIYGFSFVGSTNSTNCNWGGLIDIKVSSFVGLIYVAARRLVGSRTKKMNLKTRTVTVKRRFQELPGPSSGTAPLAKKNGFVRTQECTFFYGFFWVF